MRHAVEHARRAYEPLDVTTDERSVDATELEELLFDVVAVVSLDPLDEVAVDVEVSLLDAAGES